jgi:GrpB-like predicted nucleotidyltransferase (UPF0157 family)
MEDAQRYATLKRRLAEQYGQDRLSYAEAKEPFIWEIIKKANRWSQDGGWQPGATDL